MTPEEIAAQRTIALRAQTKAVEHLMGMVQGMVADQHLHNLEIRLLSTWLSEHTEATAVWPGNVIARKLRYALEDGVITEPERAHLIDTLNALLSNDFSSTGSASDEPTALPIDDNVTVILRDAGVCHTGTFLYGTRADVERLSLRAGAMAFDSVSKKVDYLVIGTRVSPGWAHTSFGRKIQRAVELQEAGHPVEIISERRWFGTFKLEQ